MVMQNLINANHYRIAPIEKRRPIKWGTHDALLAQRPVKEVAKATASFGLLRSLSDEFPKGKFFPGVFQNNTDTVGAISVV